MVSITTRKVDNPPVNRTKLRGGIEWHRLGAQPVLCSPVFTPSRDTVASISNPAGPLHAKAHTTTLLLASTLLHLLADLDVDVEELGDTAVQADRLALVQVALAVVGGDALLGAGLGEAVDGKIG